MWDTLGEQVARRIKKTHQLKYTRVGGKDLLRKTGSEGVTSGVVLDPSRHRGTEKTR